MGLTADGGITVAGLEWMGARAYDPVAREFLSVDPLAPVTGPDGRPTRIRMRAMNRYIRLILWAYLRYLMLICKPMRMDSRGLSLVV